jgi:hypothetical protein
VEAAMKLKIELTADFSISAIIALLGLLVEILKR